MININLNDMRDFFKFSLSVFLMGFALISCEKDDEQDQLPAPEPVKPRELVETRAWIGNQHLSSNEYPSYYNFQDGKAFSDPDKAADFAFVSYNSVLKMMMVRLDKLTEEQEQDLEKNGKECKQEVRKTEFYIFPKSFKTTDFDTLTSPRALELRLIGAKLSVHPTSLEHGYFVSDEFGWSVGQLIGFKDQEGRAGVIKIEDMRKVEDDLEEKNKYAMRIVVKYDKYADPR
jgi:hypothetical protein